MMQKAEELRKTISAAAQAQESNEAPETDAADAAPMATDASAASSSRKRKRETQEEMTFQMMQQLTQTNKALMDRLEQSQKTVAQRDSDITGLKRTMSSMMEAVTTSLNSQNPGATSRAMKPQRRVAPRAVPVQASRAAAAAAADTPFDASGYQAKRPRHEEVDAAAEAAEVRASLNRMPQIDKKSLNTMQAHMLMTFGPSFLHPDATTDPTLARIKQIYDGVKA